MRVSAADQQRMDHITRRFLLTKQLQVLINEIVAGDYDSNEIQEIFGTAGVMVHPVMVQNLLARRAQQKSSA
jgi:hypothetical protein